MSAPATQVGVGRIPDASDAGLSRSLLRVLSVPLLGMALALQLYLAPHPWGWSSEAAAKSAIATAALNSTRVDGEESPLVIAALTKNNRKAVPGVTNIVAPDYHGELLSVRPFNDDQAEAKADLDMKLASYLLNRTLDASQWMGKGEYRLFPSNTPDHSYYLKLPLRIELQRDPILPVWRLADLREALPNEPQFVSFWSDPMWNGRDHVPRVRLTPFAQRLAALAESPLTFKVLLLVFGLGAALCLLGESIQLSLAGLGLALTATTAALAIAPYLAWVFCI